MSDIQIGRESGNEAERVRQISSAAHQFKQHDLGQRAIAEGWPMEKFQKSILESFSARPAQTVSDLGLTDTQKRDFSLVRLLRHLANPTDRRIAREAGFELEVTKAAERGEGVTIPMEALAYGRRDLTVGSATQGSKLVGTDHLANDFVEMLRARMFVADAGARFLTGLQGNVAIPKQSGATTAHWVAESGTITESNATFSQISMVPHDVGCLQDISRRLLMQSSPDVEQLIRADFAAVLAREIDRVSIEGNPDATATANEPRGIIQTAGVGSVAGGTNGAAPTRDHLIDLERALGVGNADQGSLAYAFSPRVKAKLAKTNLDAGSGRFVIESPNEVNGHRYYTSTIMPDDLTKGSGSDLSAILFCDWSSLIVGVWDRLTILADPYTHSASGGLRLVSFATVDVALRNPEAAAVMLDANAA